MGRDETGGADLTSGDTATLDFDAELGSRVPPRANTTDLMIAHIIIDARQAGDDEPLMLHGKKIFDTDKPTERVALDDTKIFRLAYRESVR